MGERLDAEAVRELMFAYFHEMRGAIERHGGTVEKFVGDAVMAVFGVPQAHEDDPLRACRAALEMQQRIPELNGELDRRYGATLALRMGVNTGEVVAGDASTRETFVSGDAVNTAARLEQAAQPGEVLLGAATYQIVRSSVVAEAVGPIDAKGKAEPLSAYRLISVPFTPTARRRLQTPLVGREPELAALRTVYQEVLADAAPRRVVVSGEPGIGKSRLVAEFLETAAAEARVLSARCLPYGEGITYWPLAEIVRSAAGIHDDHDRVEAQSRIGRLVGDDLIADPLAQAIGLRQGSATPGEIGWAARRLAEALAAERPLVLVVDDVQWAEDAMLELLAGISERGRGRILILCLARPELGDRDPTWQATVTLGPLGDSAITELLAQLRDGTVSARDRVVAASGGNPLFLEELAAMLDEDESDGIERHIPPTLDALLAARLDRLPVDVREAAERASVEGQVFHRGAVALLGDTSAPSDIQSALTALEEQELVVPAAADFIDEAAYRFRHLLIRDAAYRGLSKRLRAELHEKLATWLEEKSGERLAEFEEVVGHHLRQAYRYWTELGPPSEGTRELAGRTAAHLVAAGRRARARGDHAAVVALLTSAIELLPPGQRRAEFQVHLADSLYRTGNVAAAAASAREAAAFASELGDRRLELSARLRAAAVTRGTETSDQAVATRELAEEALGVFEASGDDVGLVQAWTAIGEFEAKACRWQARADALEHALVHARRTDDEFLERVLLGQLAFAYRLGPMGVESALAWHARMRGNLRRTPTLVMSRAPLEAMLGHFDEARNLNRVAIEQFEETGTRIGVINSLAVRSQIEVLADDLAAAEEATRRECELLEVMGAGGAGYLSTSAGELGRILALSRRYDEAEMWSREGERLGSDDDIVTQILWRQGRAIALAHRGSLEEGERVAREAVALARETDMLNHQGDAVMDLAEVLELAARRAEAASVLREAVALYERKGNVVMSNRALARLR